MPYIPETDREDIDAELEELTRILSLHKWPVGMVNYAISQIMWTWFREVPGYTTINSVRGVLGCVWDEFYRRIGAPYEEVAKGRNGDLSTFTHFFDGK